MWDVRRRWAPNFIVFTSKTEKGEGNIFYSLLHSPAVIVAVRRVGSEYEQDICALKNDEKGPDLLHVRKPYNYCSCQCYCHCYYYYYYVHGCFVSTRMGVFLCQTQECHSFERDSWESRDEIWIHDDVHFYLVVSCFFFFSLTNVVLHTMKRDNYYYCLCLKTFPEQWCVVFKHIKWHRYERKELERKREKTKSSSIHLTAIRSYFLRHSCQTKLNHSRETLTHAIIHTCIECVLWEFTFVLVPTIREKLVNIYFGSSCRRKHCSTRTSACTR
jgi:hypothetical protein